MAELTEKKRDKLRSNQFAYVDKDGGEHLPINDESHVRNAMARWNQTDFDSSRTRSGRAGRSWLRRRSTGSTSPTTRTWRSRPDDRDARPRRRRRRRGHMGDGSRDHAPLRRAGAGGHGAGGRGAAERQALRREHGRPLPGANGNRSPDSVARWSKPSCTTGCGAVPGALYAVARHVPVVRALNGVGYGLALFVANDELLNTRLGFAGPARAYPPETHFRGLAGHVVLGRPPRPGSSCSAANAGARRVAAASARRPGSGRLRSRLRGGSRRGLACPPDRPGRISCARSSPWRATSPTGCSCIQSCSTSIDRQPAGRTTGRAGQVVGSPGPSLMPGRP